MERPWTGIFECPECEIEYEVQTRPESDLACKECGGTLLAVLIRIQNTERPPAPMRKPEEQRNLFND
jgi:PHP family Zn ribbon phosphoesterase